MNRTDALAEELNKRSFPSDLEEVNTLSPELRIIDRLVFQGKIMLQLTCARELFLLRQITLFHIMWTRFKQIFLWFMRRRSLHELVSSHICDYICNNIVVIHTHILVPWWKKWQGSEKNQRSMIHWYLKSKLRAYQPGYRRNRNFILFQLGNMVGCGFHKSWDRLQ